MKKSPNCFRPWCGLEGKYCIECLRYSPKADLLAAGSRPGQEVTRVEMELRPALFTQGPKPLVVALREMGRPRYGFPDPFAASPIQGGDSVVTLYLAEDEAERLGRLLLKAAGVPVPSGIRTIRRPTVDVLEQAEPGNS